MKPSDYRTRHCLAIGIDQYTDYPRLHNAVTDALGFAKLLRESFGFADATLLNQEATRDGIAGAIADSLRSGASAEDLVVIFFAGHGHTEQLPDGREHGYLVPVSARRHSLADLVSMHELANWTNYLPSRHILYIFDSCFSGLVTLRASHSTPRRDMLARRARLAITAGGATETVEDGGWNHHSIFTGLLLQALENDTTADDEGVSTASSLFSYLAKEVPAQANQTPSLGTLPGHEGGDILLRRCGPRPRHTPVSTAPPPFVGHFSERLPRSGHTTRSSITPKQGAQIARTGVGTIPVSPDVTVFATVGRQWALIVGTNPSFIEPDPATIPTEFLDAWDVLDWFISPDIYGAVPPEQLFFLVDRAATGENVFRSFDEIERGVGPEDSVLLFFSGHAMTAGRPGELVLCDAYDGQSWGMLTAETRGVIRADWLIDWMNRVRAVKVVAILDTGGYPVFRASRRLEKGRYVLSSIRGLTLGRNGFVTWYVRRAVQRLGVKVTLSSLIVGLEEAEKLWIERHRDPLYVYLHGSD